MYMNTNTRILAPEFAFARPASLAEAFALMKEHGPGARLLAGGTDLLVQMKMERLRPELVISLSGVKELAGITDGDGLTIGAATTIWEISKSPEVGARVAALREACNAFSTVSIMFMGTLGGNLCNASPAADSAPALLVHDASVVIRSVRSERRVPLAEFFTGPGRTVLKPGEIVTAVTIPAPTAGTGSAFRKISRVVADISQVCAAVSLVREGGRVTACRIALGSVAPTPVRVARAEAALVGANGTAEAFAAAAEIVAADIRPISDVRASESYRRHVAQTIVRDALQTAWQRAGEGVSK
ncbi:FAD binding domain-containing protein [Albidovulum sp.]|jgi:carbon-monoxide dehydrogenase medium subunit|uniref:FAD binding domain-containing protein n=1 Tax=Albidovulum sp. TaxID=1872424 RepID=UPI0039B9C82B